MAKNDDVNKANEGAPAADIPNLKEKEKERKKAGAAWGGARGGPGSFSGATGGNVARAAASAASAAGEAGAAGAAGAFGAGGAGGLAGLFSGGFSSFLAGLASTLVGKMILGVAAMALLMGGALAAYALLKGGGAAGAGGYGDLGALSSNMSVRGAGVDRTGYVASKGEIAFDPAKPAANAAEKKEEKPAEAPPAGDAVPPNQTADAAGKGGADWNRPGLEHNMSGARLSSSLGGGNFGGKNIFGGGSAANKLGDSMGRFNIQGGQKGKLSGRSATGRTGRVTSGTSRAGPKASKAFGQLKVARGASMAGAGSSTTEGAAASAARAFDGSNIGGANTGGGPGGTTTGPTSTNPGGGSTNPGGPGAPDITDPPDPNAGIDYKGEQTAAMIAAIAAMAQKAGEMKKKGMMLMAVGAALIALGAILWGPWGAVIAAIGAMILGMGLMMMQMAAKMKAMADSMSEQLAATNTDQQQNAINKYCIDKAYNGTPPSQCNPPEDVSHHQQNTTDSSAAVREHKKMKDETGRVEGDNGRPIE